MKKKKGKQPPECFGRYTLACSEPIVVRGRTFDTYTRDDGAVYERDRNTGEMFQTIPPDEGE
jgi:hypothetical protein